MHGFSLRGKIFLIVGIVILVGGGGTCAYLWKSNSWRTDEWNRRVKVEWKEIASLSIRFAEALNSASGTEDFQKILDSAKALNEKAKEAKQELRNTKIPWRYEKKLLLEETALKSLSDYLTFLIQISQDANEEKIREEKTIIDDKARIANQDISDFVVEILPAGYYIPADIFYAGDVLSGESGAEEGEKEAVYQTICTFLNADIKENNIWLVWEMLSSMKKKITEVFRLPKEKFPEIWRDLWGNNMPDSFYVSKSSVKFTGPTNAEVNVIVYYGGKNSKINTVKLVKEGSEWKVDGYPFAGLN
ncbi:MAG: hypothetical protein PHP64_05560 [Actinomycetota bacterium]|nr:hypothetical protein [Actinomycetota bacterium]